MPTFNSGTLSGEGLAVLPSGGPFVDIFVVLETDANIQFLSGSPLRRLMHAGWYGLCYDNAGVDPSLMCWWKYLEFDGELIALSPMQIFADHLIWHLAAGVEIHIGVDY